MECNFEIEKNEVVFDISFANVDYVYMLPLEYCISVNSTSYPASSASLYKVLKNKISTNFLSEPESLVELRSSDWFGPILMITAQVYSQNPDVCQFIIDSIRETLNGVISKRNKEKINVEIVCEKTASTKMISVKYCGDDAGLDNLLKTVREVMNDN